MGQKRKRDEHQGDLLESLRLMIERQNLRIEELERINEMHVRAEELSRQERIDAERMIEARERLQGLSEQERIAAEMTIRAQEGVQRLAEQELRQADKTIKAQETLHEFTEKERLAAEETIRAQEEIQHLASQERLHAEQMLAAHDRIEMLTVSEIKQRDAVLAAILSMNVCMNALQPVDDLLEHTLREACRLFSASRGFIARYTGASMTPIARSGFVYEAEADSILEAILAGRSVVGLHAKLSREGRTIGVLYLERTMDADGFSAIDHEFLEILASQLSVGFNNSMLYHRLRQQNRELRRMIMLKNNFIEHLSSDLQRPLGKLVDLINGEDCSRQQEAINLAEWLRRTVNKVISMAALQNEVDEMYLHSIRMDIMIREIVENLGEEIRKRKLSIQYEFPEEVHPFEGNQDIIHTIMDEVICNAVVYNRDSGSVRIVINQDSQFCHITIMDTGIGIRKEELDKVFERFYRAGTSHDMYNRGAGLGLYIVRNFIETYGGSISLSSIHGKGTEVALAFPM
ncbi:MAG TPA: ATP-binding protein [Spirochaetota bacterium]|nr:ATP-binding protein [Spirochaetota bacterium]